MQTMQQKSPLKSFNVSRNSEVEKLPGQHPALRRMGIFAKQFHFDVAHIIVSLLTREAAKEELDILGYVCYNQYSGRLSWEYDQLQKGNSEELIGKLLDLSEEASISPHPTHLQNNSSILDHYRSEFESRYSHEYQKFKSHRIDRPYVSAVSVDDSHRRKGIGTALYKEANDWMKEKGLSLHSDIQPSQEAKALWEKLVRCGKAERVHLPLGKVFKFK